MMSESNRFTEDILTTARGRAESLVREAEAEAQRASEEAKLAISKDVETLIRNALADADAVKRRQISEARHRSKLREQQEKDAIMQEVLGEAKKRSLEFTLDETRYIPLLSRLIESGIRELGDSMATIHLNEADLKRISPLAAEKELKSLSERVKIEWSKEPIAASGGAIISSKDGRVRIVNTLDQRLEALEPKLLIEASKTLFGE
jgi:V/A-type H+-transporting ATPase subunit E